MFKNNAIKALLISWRRADVHLPYVFLIDRGVTNMILNQTSTEISFQF